MQRKNKINKIFHILLRVFKDLKVRVKVRNQQCLELLDHLLNLTVCARFLKIPVLIEVLRRIISFVISSLNSWHFIIEGASLPLAGFKVELPCSELIVLIVSYCQPILIRCLQVNQ